MTVDASKTGETFLVIFGFYSLFLLILGDKDMHGAASCSTGDLTVQSYTMYAETSTSHFVG